ncbi:MAG: hypothetical protein PHE83_12700 [Opitutaceae bacterium]|nr:hypothetical protein [Opitutaceae bacterium]
MKLTKAEQQEWLRQHIPHRVGGSIACTEVLDEKIAASGAVIDQGAVRNRCANHAIWEGRFAATRWLIEFVGVSMDKHGEPTRPHHGDFSARIDNFEGGMLFDLSTPEAKKLAKIWLGCTQATSHATHGSNHPSIRDPERNEALRIIWSHLENTIYRGTGVSMI